jgi:MFS family permease
MIPPRELPSVSLVHAWRLLRARARHSRLLHPQTRDDRNEVLFYLNTGMFGFATGGIMAFLPVFLARLGASSTLLGWFNAAPALIATVLLIPGAMIAERSTDQVQVRVRSAYLIKVVYLLVAVIPFAVPPDNYYLLPPILVAVWLLKAFPEAVALPAWTSVMARGFSPRRRARVNGARWAIMSLASAVGSAVFGQLLERIAFPLNYQIVFLISFALSIADPLIFSKVKVDPTAVPQMTAQPYLWARLMEYVRPALSYRPFVRYLLATGLYRITLFLGAPLFSLFWVNELQASDGLLGFRATLGSSALMIGYVVWGHVASRWGHRRVLFVGAWGLACYVLVTALSPSALWLLPAAVLWGLSAPGIDLGLFDLMLASCPDERQPLFGAVWSIAANLAMFVGPLLGARLGDWLGMGTALMVVAGVQVLSTAPFLALPREG